MHESGRCVSETIDPIENAAMAGDEAARILDAEIALEATPPIRPSQVFFGLTVGVTLWRPNSLPQQYCATSLNWVSATRKDRRPSPPATGLTRSPETKSHAMWLKGNTVIIRPQDSGPTARKKPCASASAAISAVKNSNIHTGTNTMNMPYQSIAAQ